jgi:hypothetical protein
MAKLQKENAESLQELMLSTLAKTAALTKLLIEKGLITEVEFTRKLFEDRAIYQRILNPTPFGDFH